MNKKSKQILAKTIAVLHGLLVSYVIVTTVWFLITFRINTYVVVALALGVWIMSFQKLIIGGCPLTFVENRLRGMSKHEKFMIRFWRFFGIRIKQEEKTLRVLRWGSLGLFFVVLAVRLIFI